MRPIMARLTTNQDFNVRIVTFVTALIFLQTSATIGQAVRQGNPLRRPANVPLVQQNVAAKPAGQASQASYMTVEPLAETVVAGDIGCDSGCFEPAFAPCCPQLWGSLEYLIWWDRSADLPPLATTSPVGTGRDNAGVIGVGTTEVLFGGDQGLNNDALNGGRLMIGGWLDPGRYRGVGARGFGMEQQSDLFSASSDDFAILARPFFNAFTGEEDALLLGFPDEIAGNMQARLETETQGAQVFYRHLTKTGCNYRIDFLAGYRYLGVRDSLSVDNSLTFIDPTSLAFGTQIDQRDRFDIDNDFHGGEIGWMGHSVDGRWTLDFMTTVAFGAMNQTATVSGSSVTTPVDGDAINLVGGLLTQQSNIGVYEDDPFTVVPEATVQVGYFLTPRLDISIGYTFLYLHRVARTGPLVDRAVNLTQQTGELEGPARPEFTLGSSSYWLQGLNLGLNLRF